MITSKTPEGGAAGRRSSTPTTITTVEHGSHEEGNDPRINDKDDDEEIIEAARQREAMHQTMMKQKQKTNANSDQTNGSTPRTTQARMQEDRKIMHMRHGNRGTRNHDETMKELHKEGKERGSTGKQLRDMIKDVERAVQKENDEREYFEKEMNARWAGNMKAIYSNTMTELQELRRTIQSEETRKRIDEQLENFNRLAQMMEREAGSENKNSRKGTSRHEDSTDTRGTLETSEAHRETPEGNLKAG